MPFQSLLGLYDLFVETEDPAVRQLFTDRIEGLKTTICLGLSEAMELVRVSRIPVSTCLSSAEPDALGSSGTSVGHTAVNGVCRKLEVGSPLHAGRTEIYFGFLITKNACRRRNRTWCQSRNKIRALASREIKATS